MCACRCDYGDKYSKISYSSFRTGGSESDRTSGIQTFYRYAGVYENVYDYIIIDCPPLGLVIDAAIIGGQSDGAIIVVEAGKTKYRLVQNVKDQLENSGVSVLGVVLNKVERKNQKGYYNKYYGSQKYEGYYGHNKETKNA